MIFVKLIMWRAESGILQPSSSSPLGHWTFSSHLFSRMWHWHYGTYWHIVLWNIFTNFTKMIMINMRTSRLSWEKTSLSCYLLSLSPRMELCRCTAHLFWICLSSSTAAHTPPRPPHLDIEYDCRRGTSPSGRSSYPPTYRLWLCTSGHLGSLVPHLPAWFQCCHQCTCCVLHSSTGQGCHLCISNHPHHSPSPPRRTGSRTEWGQMFSLWRFSLQAQCMKRGTLHCTRNKETSSWKWNHCLVHLKPVVKPLETWLQQGVKICSGSTRDWDFS